MEEDEKQTIELWLAVNDEGSHAVSLEGAADAITILVGECGGAAVRTVRMLVSMPLPTSVEVDPIEIFEEIEAGETEASVDEVETAAAA